MSSSYKVVHAAGVVVLTRQTPRQFLLMKHSNRWDFPKGCAEPGETAVETALRETEEETGLSTDQVRVDPNFRHRLVYPVRYSEHPNKLYEKRLTLFLGWIEQAVPIMHSEHQGYCWWDWQPPHRIQAQTIDPTLAAIEAFLQSVGG